MTHCDVLLIRHGQSTWNSLGRWQGQADPPLSSEGREQAIQCRPAFEALGHLDLLGSSPLVRAADTAKLLAPAREVVIFDWLTERFAGPWQGLTRAEIGEQWPGYLDDGRRPEGYEDDPMMLTRVRPGLEELAAAYPGQRLVLIAHAGVIGCVERLAGLEWNRTPNLGGRWFQVNGDAVAAGEQVMLADSDLSNPGDPRAV